MQSIEKFFRRHGRPGKASPDETLLVRGNIVKRVHYIQSGQVLLHLTSHDGRQYGFEIVPPGQILGFGAVVYQGRSFMDATTLTACEFLSVQLSAFENAFRTDAEIVRELFYHASELLFRRTRQAEDLAVHSLRKRLARFLVALAHEQSGGLGPDKSVHLELNQKLMAAMAGVTRETINRQLNTWIRAGLLAVDGKTIHILKPDALAKLAGPLDDIFLRSRKST